MRRRILTIALVLFGTFATFMGLMAAPSTAAETDDPRATPHDGNAVKCADVGFPNSIQVGANADGDASDANVSGVADGQFLDVTVDEGIVIDAIVVKAGDAYNVYGPEDAPFTDLRAPLVGSGQLPGISHWFICYHVGETTTTSSTTTTSTTAPTTTSTTTTSTTTSTTSSTTSTTTSTTVPTTSTTAPTTSTTAQVLGSSTVPTTAATQVAGVQLARTGASAQFWYVLAACSLLLGGASLCTTARRLSTVKR